MDIEVSLLERGTHTGNANTQMSPANETAAMARCEVPVKTTSKRGRRTRGADTYRQQVCHLQRVYLDVVRPLLWVVGHHAHLHGSLQKGREPVELTVLIVISLRTVTALCAV